MTQPFMRSVVTRPWIVALVLAGSASGAIPALAQATPDRQEVEATRQLNRETARRQQITLMEAERQYQHDVAAYDRSIRARQRAVAIGNAQYRPKRHAYAAAMAAWREQVAACKTGKSAACRAPTPDPASFL